MAHRSCAALEGSAAFSPMKVSSRFRYKNCELAQHQHMMHAYYKPHLNPLGRHGWTFDGTPFLRRLRNVVVRRAVVFVTRVTVIRSCRTLVVFFSREFRHAAQPFTGPFMRLCAGAGAAVVLNVVHVEVLNVAGQSQLTKTLTPST